MERFDEGAGRSAPCGFNPSLLFSDVYPGIARHPRLMFTGPLREFFSRGVALCPEAISTASRWPGSLSAWRRSHDSSEGV
jgi:hypothetical protein